MSENGIRFDAVYAQSAEINTVEDHKIVLKNGDTISIPDSNMQGELKKKLEKGVNLNDFQFFISETRNGIIASIDSVYIAMNQ